jgi:DNA-binding GntR family transcriptional regulator
MGNQRSKSPYAFIPPLRRQKRGGAVQHIQDLVREAIVQLALPPGAFIDKAALCERLGVSRFPVSEALGRLADEGFVEVLPQHGTMVARIRLADVQEAMFIRSALEAGAVRRLAAETPKGLIADLQANLKEQEAMLRHDDDAGFHALDLAFHAMLIDAVGFERVRTTIDASRASLDRMRLFLCTPQRKSATFTEHRAIIDGLAAADPDRAGRAMEIHLDAVMAELATYAAAHPHAVEEPAGGSAAA